MRFDLGRLVHADGLIVVEIPLHHAALVDRDLCPQRIGQSKDDSALNLLFEHVRIDHPAAINRRYYPMHARTVFFPGTFDSSTSVGTATPASPNPAIPPRRCRC